ncbi:MAG: hypothetical protein JWP27_2749 [Flaviaesturariibacter sp.]|nr:hypothetical protein [Flaviaesturariibacter sp.]
MSLTLHKRASAVFYRLRHWETWHYLAKYIPIMPVWGWHCLRARSLWFFTPSNPTLAFGGFEGESKHEMYEQLPPGSFPKSRLVAAGLALEEVEAIVQANGFRYPFAVKPDVGMMGFMFRRVRTREELGRYHAAMPVDYFIQELVDEPLEVSVFYYRFPGEASGTITGFLKKEFLEVVGDGRSTLLELMENYPRVQFRLEEMKSKHADRLGTVLPAGEICILSQALNLSRGGRLVSLAHEKDAALLAVFDGLSHATKTFYYGRYDIKCRSIDDLKKGRHFSILEYNGCGAEPHHIYGNGNNLLQAYAIVLHHWRVLAKISRENHKRGHHRWTYRRGLAFLREAKRHFAVLKRLDREFPMN